MLKQRIITALFLLPIVLAGILLLPDHLFAVFWAFVLNLAAYEWLKLSGISKRVFLLLGLVVLNGLFALIWFKPVSGYPVEWGILLVWAFIIISFTGDPVARLQRTRPGIYVTIGIVAGLLILIPTWLAMVLLHQQTPWLVLYVFGIVWVADVGAYFSGKLFGKHKLAVAISPGKSWEGVWGGLILVAVYSSVVALLWFEQAQIGLFVLISLLAGAVSVAGDLLESVFKRARGVKDSGTLLPGHGGVMDRLDSIIAAAPIFTAAYYIAGWL